MGENLITQIGHNAAMLSKVTSLILSFALSMQWLKIWGYFVICVDDNIC